VLSRALLHNRLHNLRPRNYAYALSTHLYPLHRFVVIFSICVSEGLLPIRCLNNAHHGRPAHPVVCSAGQERASGIGPLSSAGVAEVGTEGQGSWGHWDNTDLDWFLLHPLVPGASCRMTASFPSQHRLDRPKARSNQHKTTLHKPRA